MFSVTAEVSNIVSNLATGGGGVLLVGIFGVGIKQLINQQDKAEQFTKDINEDRENLRAENQNLRKNNMALWEENVNLKSELRRRNGDPL